MSEKEGSNFLPFNFVIWSCFQAKICGTNTQKCILSTSLTLSLYLQLPFPHVSFFTEKNPFPYSTSLQQQQQQKLFWGCVCLSSGVVLPFVFGLASKEPFMSKSVSDNLSFSFCYPFSLLHSLLSQFPILPKHNFCSDGFFLHLLNGLVSHMMWHTTFLSWVYNTKQ